MLKGDRKILDSPKTLLEELARAGSNIRVFKSEKGSGSPCVEERIIRVMAVEYSSELGDHVLVYIVPKFSKHVINYFIHPGNRKDESDPSIESSGADENRAVITLSNEITYNVYYRSNNLPDESRQLMQEEGNDYNVGDLFGINY